MHPFQGGGRPGHAQAALWPGTPHWRATHVLTGSRGSGSSGTVRRQARGGRVFVQEYESLGSSGSRIFHVGCRHISVCVSGTRADHTAEFSLV